MVFPILLGAGKRLFADGVDTTSFDLVETKRTGDVVILALSDTALEVGHTGRKELSVAKAIDCPCGETVRGENDDELVSNTEEHIQDKHPEMVGTRSREEILAMAHDA